MTATATSQELAVVHPTTGEVLDLKAAPTEGLAAAVDYAADLRRQLQEFESALGDELVARLDRAASWTLRCGPPDGLVQYEVKAPSPEAGTTAYDEHAMEQELRALLERGTIAPEAAQAALERGLNLVVRVPFDADLDALEGALRGAVSITISDVECEVVAAGGLRKTSAAGIKALLKVPGTKAAIERATRRVTPPARKAKVKAIRKEAARAR